jgi:hypothetical protein
VRSLAFYTYWQDVPVDTVELYSSDRCLAGAFPTNDGLTVTYVGWPLAEFDMFRRDPLANVRATLDAAGSLGERIRAGFPPQSVAERRLFAALAEDRAAASRFFGVMSGVVPPAAFFAPANLVRLVGVRGFAGLARGQLRPAPYARAASTAQ